MQEFELNYFFRQVYLQTIYKIRSRYRKTWTGFLWVVLNPIILYSVQSVIFQIVLKIQMPHYTVFLLGGLLPWIFISSSMEMGIPSLVSNAHLLKGLPVNPLVLVISQVADNFFNFIVTFILILIPVLTVSRYWNYALLTLPITLAMIFAFTSAVTVFFAFLNVAYRDTRYVISFVLNVIYFVTPIFYPAEIIPDKFRFLLHFNPIYHLIQLFRGAIYHFSLMAYLYHLAMAFAATAIILTITIKYWRKKKNDIYHLL